MSEVKGFSRAKCPPRSRCSSNTRAKNFKYPDDQMSFKEMDLELDHVLLKICYESKIMSKHEKALKLSYISL